MILARESARGSTCMSRGDTTHESPSARAAAFKMSVFETGPIVKSLAASLS